MCNPVQQRLISLPASHSQPELCGVTIIIRVTDIVIIIVIVIIVIIFMDFTLLPGTDDWDGDSCQKDFDDCGQVRRAGQTDFVSGFTV